MFEGLQHLVSLDRPTGALFRDFVDILIVAFIIYRALLVLKGTRAMQMGIGVVAFGGLYLLAKYAQLATLISVLSWVASSAILIVVVIFQSDIRRALIRVGSKAWLTRGPDAQERVLDEVVAATTELARHRMGAIIALERDADIGEFVQSRGIELDSLVTRELLVSLFIPEAVNKTHDGAVLIRNHRIQQAGVFFQMPEEARVEDPTLGSRHRAAIGITERTDALVVVVSEERGTITLFFNTNSVLHLTADGLRDALAGLFGRTSSPGWFSRLTSILGRRAADDASPASTEPGTDKRLDKARASKTDKPDKAKVERKSDKPAPRPSQRPSRPPPAGDKQPIKGTPSAIKASASKAGPSGIKAGPSAIKAGPSAIKAGPSGAVKSTKQSGSFRAMKSQSEGSKVDEKPAGPRVSVPMPSSTTTAKDEEPTEPRDEESTETHQAQSQQAQSQQAQPQQSESPKPPPSVSKPMTPTELPSTTLRSGDDT